MRDMKSILTEAIEPGELDDFTDDEKDEFISLCIDLLNEIDMEDDTLPDNIITALYNIYELFDEPVPSTDTNTNESLAPKLKRTKSSQKLKNKRDYRKNKAKLKRQAKKYRRTAAYRKYKKKAKRMSKYGKTSTGQRKTRRK